MLRDRPPSGVVEGSVGRSGRRVGVERRVVQELGRVHQGLLGLGLDGDGAGVVDVGPGEGCRCRVGETVQDAGALLEVAGVLGLLGRVAVLLLGGGVLVVVGTVRVGGGDGRGGAEVADGGGVAVVQLDGGALQVVVELVGGDVVLQRDVRAGDGDAVLDLDRGAELADLGAGLGAVLLHDLGGVGDRVGLRGTTPAGEGVGAADGCQEEREDQDGLTAADLGVRAVLLRLVGDGFHEKLLEEVLLDGGFPRILVGCETGCGATFYSAASGLSYTMHTSVNVLAPMGDKYYVILQQNAQKVNKQYNIK